MRVLLVAAILAALSVPARSECLLSADAVWSAHPGSHATWRMQLPGHQGTKCWFARGSMIQQAPRARQVVDSPRGTDAAPRTDGQAKTASGPANVSAADHPNETPARSEPPETPPSQHPTSILIWGRPMSLDAAWQEIFARRERRGE
jgi:hypothetical protein